MKDRMTAAEYQEYLRTGRVDSEPKRKYKNKPTEYDGKLHPSQHEANEIAQIKLRWRSGEFPAYAEQVEFLLPGGIIYRADAVILKTDMTYEVVEPKGAKTEG